MVSSALVITIIWLSGTIRASNKTKIRCFATRGVATTRDMVANMAIMSSQGRSCRHQRLRNDGLRFFCRTGFTACSTYENGAS